MKIFLNFCLLLIGALSSYAHPGHHDAMNRVDKRLEITPNAPEILMERAFLYFSAGHIADAQRDLDQVRRIEEDFEGLDELQLKLFMARGESVAAEALLSALLLEKPGEKSLLFDYSEVLIAQQKWGDAANTYMQWLNAQGESRPEEAIGLLMELKKGGGDLPKKAYNLLDKTIEDIGELPVLSLTKAGWLQVDGRLAEALVVFEALHSRFPGNADYAYRKGWLLEQLGNTSDAHRVYRAAMRHHESLSASRKNAPARLEVMNKLQMALERTLDDDH